MDGAARTLRRSATPSCGRGGRRLHRGGASPHQHPPTARRRRWAVSTADRLTGSWTAPSAPDTRWTNWSPLEVSWSLWGETMLGTGGRRARTVAILVGVVAVVGGLFVDRAIADTGDPAPAAVAARNQPLVSGTPCSVSARSCVDLDSQRAWLIDNGRSSAARSRSPRAVRGRRRRSGTRSGCTARTRTTRATSSDSPTAAPRRCRGRYSSPTAGSPSTPAIPPEPRQVASTYRKPTRRRGSSSYSARRSGAHAYLEAAVARDRRRKHGHRTP